MKNRFSLVLAILFLWLTAVTKAQQSTNSTYGDYTFYSASNSNKAYLIDMTGATYHSWTFASTAKTGYSSYMLPGGTIVRTVANTGNSLNGGGMTGRVQKVSWSGTVLWDYTHSSTTYCLHHDICPMPNGNVLMISYEVKTAAQATAAGCSQAITIWSEKIIEVQPTGATTGNIVWEWHLWDHLCQNFDASKPNYVNSIIQHPELLNINQSTTKDWVHMNGIDYNAALNQIVVSSHMLNEIFVIDHSTTTAEAASHSGGNSGHGGDFLYRWGKPTNYGATGTTNFNVVHDAHWVPADCPKANYLVAFNNKGGTGSKSCIDMINPPYDGYNYTLTPGSAYTPTTYNWRTTYSGSATQDMGNSQQLPNGNMLICIAMSGYLYEIDSNQAVVWSKSIGGTLPHAYRYTSCYTNGPPIISAASTSICPGDSVQLTASMSNGTGYGFTWSNGSVANSTWMSPDTTTTYVVTATNGTCTSTSSITITVNQTPPAPVITQVGNSLSSSTGTTYIWYTNGTPITGATQQTYSPTANGLYQVQITNASGCLSPLSPEFNFIIEGIDNDIQAANINLAPNPGNGIFHITGTFRQDYQCRVMDVTGKVILEATNCSELNLSDKQNGLYFVKITSGNQSIYNGKVLLIK